MLLFALGFASGAASVAAFIWWFLSGIDRAHDSHDSHMADMKDEARL